MVDSGQRIAASRARGVLEFYMASRTFQENKIVMHLTVDGYTITASPQGALDILDELGEVPVGVVWLIEREP